jgi:TDG/mug DNA glycosylase family protein
VSLRKTAFGAHADERTRVLVCGSLPGERSLAEQRYYAHPSNRFWQLLGAVLDCDLASLDYHLRIERTVAAGIGLWDVVKSAHRLGSLDAAIRDHEPNELGFFAETLPCLRAIAFNGGTASAIGRGQVSADRIDLIDLPSSSAAYAAMPFAEKRARWLVLREFLDSRLPPSA